MWCVLYFVSSYYNRNCIILGNMYVLCSQSYYNLPWWLHSHGDEMLHSDAICQFHLLLNIARVDGHKIILQKVDMYMIVNLNNMFTVITIVCETTGIFRPYYFI